MHTDSDGSMVSNKIVCFLYGDFIVCGFFFKTSVSS